METNELKNIWNTLADNKLVDEQLAKENIKQIITKKGLGLFSKMKKKVLVDYWVYLLGLIIVPVLTTLVHIHLMKPLPTIQAYFGLAFAETYLIYMFVNARRKLSFIEYTNHKLSIKEGLIALQEKLKKSISLEYRLGILFGISFICFAIIQFIITNGEFSTIAAVLLIAMLFIFPFAFKYEFKIRFSDLSNHIEETIHELNSETE